jgi:hypothetical protein
MYTDPPAYDLKPYLPRLSSMEAYLSIRAEASWVSEIVGDGMKVCDSPYFIFVYCLVYEFLLTITT